MDASYDRQARQKKCFLHKNQNNGGLTEDVDSDFRNFLGLDEFLDKDGCFQQPKLTRKRRLVLSTSREILCCIQYDEKKLRVVICAHSTWN